MVTVRHLSPSQRHVLPLALNSSLIAGFIGKIIAISDHLKNLFSSAQI
jgi:hypothetical protein